MANKSNLLKEAIADAKAVRETAIANAKLALEEAFTPKLQSMLSRKIEEDMEDEDDTVEEQSDSSNIGAGDNKVNYADGNDEEKAETKTSSAAPGTEGEDKVVDKLTENEDEEESTAEMYKEEEDEDEVTETEDEEEVAEEEDSELDAELAEIIKELEAEDEEGTAEMAMEDEDEDEVSETEDDEVSETEDDEVSETEDDEVAEDEELDLEEIIKSLKEEDDEDETASELKEEEDEETKTETEKELEEAYATIKSLKGTINEVNLLNAKLLFSNKLFRSHNLTEGQKMRVIETFDRAANVREVKLVFSTLAESLSAGATRKTSITESIASKATKSTKPAKAVIVEANQFNNRMKKLAGLL